MKNKIKEHRKKMNLNKTELASMLNITAQSLANIEDGKQLPNIKTALKLARLLKVPVDELFILD